MKNARQKTIVILSYSVDMTSTSITEKQNRQKITIQYYIQVMERKT